MKRMFVVCCLAAGCSTPTAQLRQELGPRASDFLKCPEDELRFQELDRLISTTKVKISGCKREVTYKLVESRWQRTSNDEPVR
jgi:hypothetical protein